MLKDTITKASALQGEIRQKIGISIAAAFALIIALSWNEVIQSIVKQLITTLGLLGEGIWIKITVAILTTIICAIGIKIATRNN